MTLYILQPYTMKFGHLGFWLVNNSKYWSKFSTFYNFSFCRNKHLVHTCKSFISYTNILSCIIVFCFMVIITNISLFILKSRYFLSKSVIFLILNLSVFSNLIIYFCLAYFSVLSYKIIKYLIVSRGTPVT